MPEALMLFAAGFGTRMGTLTATRPKPLIEVAGVPLIDRALGLTSEAGIPRVVVNTHYHGDQIARHVEGKTGIALSHEAPEILETGGGLKHALPLLGDEDAVFSLNSDAIWTGPNPLSALAKAWDPSRMEALLMLIDPARSCAHSGSGDFHRAEDGCLRRGPGLIYGGAQIIKRAPVAAHPGRVFSLNQVWDGILNEGRLYGVVHDGSWCDVGHPEGIGQAEALLAAAQ